MARVDLDSFDFTPDKWAIPDFGALYDAYVKVYEELRAARVVVDVARAMDLSAVYAYAPEEGAFIAALYAYDKLINDGGES
jgi:hypothetical protein